MANLVSENSVFAFFLIVESVSHALLNAERGVALFRSVEGRRVSWRRGEWDDLEKSIGRKMDDEARVNTHSFILSHAHTSKNALFNQSTKYNV